MSPFYNIWLTSLISRDQFGKCQMVNMANVIGDYKRNQMKGYRCVSTNLILVVENKNNPRHRVYRLCISKSKHKCMCLLYYCLWFMQDANVLVCQAFHFTFLKSPECFHLKLIF